MAEGDINPWVRANLHEYNDETLELVPTHRIDEYVLLMDEGVLAQAALNDWLGKRHEFFREISGGEI